MENINRSDPSDLIVRKMTQGSGATGTYHGLLSVHIPLNATSTANAATNWVNPETGTVLARVFAYFTTAGTGTFDVGRGTDGTGNANGAIDGGTMTVGVHHPGTVLGTAAPSATAGIVDNSIFVVGPGATGTNNSINMTHSDTPTSTAVGGMVIEYFPIGR